MSNRKRAPVGHDSAIAIAIPGDEACRLRIALLRRRTGVAGPSLPFRMDRDIDGVQVR